MGIYIKGMEMPKSCFDCPFMYGRKYCSANSKIEFNDPDYSELKERYDGCPLVHVPPHGRLIDTEAKVKTQLYDDEHEEWSDEVELTVEQYLGYCFNEVPTIIPADTAEERHEKESF